MLNSKQLRIELPQGLKFDGTSKGFELVEENPDVYGKGCYYFVNGYGNINAGYEITTTDNKDYSSRVNLIYLTKAGYR